jgi:hypothetical protein
MARLTRPASLLAIALVVIGVVLAAVAVVYFVVPTNHIPSFLPGHLSYKRTHPKRGHFHARHYTKRGLAALAFAVVAFIGAWYAARSHREEVSV